MNEDKFKKISKSLSYRLRHHPEDIGIVISSDGWTDIKDLLEKAKLKVFFDFNDLKYVVQNNDKKRFSLSEDLCRIRANQDVEVLVQSRKAICKILWGVTVGVMCKCNV
jgi:putative RNA 2'-phosphotransferase